MQPTCRLPHVSPSWTAPRATNSSQTSAFCVDISLLISSDHDNFEPPSYWSAESPALYWELSPRVLAIPADLSSPPPTPPSRELLMVSQLQPVEATAPCCTLSPVASGPVILPISAVATAHFPQISA